MKLVVHNKNTIGGLVLYALTVIGVLCSVQFFLREGPWLDEILLILNLSERSYATLLEPLGYNQMAPVLFLWLQKICYDLSEVLPFLPRDFALRIVPLSASALILYIFSSDAGKRINSQWTQLLAVLLLGFNETFFYYASESKPYILEVATALLLITTPIGVSRSSNWVFLSIGLIGIATTTTSTIITLTALGVVQFFYALVLKDFKRVRSLVLIYGVLALFAVTYYIVFLHNNPVRAYMSEFWGPAHYPLPTFANFFQYVDENIVQFCFGKSWLLGWLDGKLVYVSLLLFLGGCLVLWRNKQQQYVLTILVILFIHFLLARLSIYPVHNRLIFYWMAFLPTIIAAALKSGASVVVAKSSSLFRISHVRIVKIATITLFIVISFYAVKTVKELPVYLNGRSYQFHCKQVAKTVTENDLVVFWRDFGAISKYFKREGLLPASTNTMEISSNNGDLQKIISRYPEIVGKGVIYYIIDNPNDRIRELYYFNDLRDYYHIVPVKESLYKGHMIVVLKPKQKEDS